MIYEHWSWNMKGVVGDKRTWAATEVPNSSSLSVDSGVKGLNIRDNIILYPYGIE